MVEKMAATDQATKGRIVKAVWIPLFEEFGNDYTIIAPDIRGLGNSSRPPSGYHKKKAAVDIRELVKSLGLRANLPRRS